jgi:large subunit ribosomal protein L15
MRLPKRGFTNAAHKVVYQPVDIRAALEVIKGDDITVAKLVEAGLVGEGVPVKLTGGRAPGGAGELKRKVNVQVHRVTASVKTAVEAKGGTVTELDKQAQ